MKNMVELKNDIAYLALLLLISAMLLCSCTFAFRSVVTQNFQEAETEGVAWSPVGGENAINADKTTETQAAVNTSSGSAATASQSQSNAEEKK